MARLTPLRVACALITGLLLTAPLLGGERLMVEAAAPGETLPPLSPTLTELHLRGFGPTRLFAQPLPEGLEALNLSDNALPVLPERFLPAGLQRLWLADNRLVELPASLAKLERLTYLNLDRNRLASLPPLDALPLRWLRLNNNCLTALPSLPATLERLYAADNQLSAAPALPAACRQVTLAGNPLAALPESWGAGLEMLDLSRTALTQLPRDLAPWRSLRLLNLTRCPLSEAERDRIEAALPTTTLLF
ncbi:MAG: leucine-rich repeat domain-containing protein [Candidatus Spyradenecus sp.]